MDANGSTLSDRQFTSALVKQLRTGHHVALCSILGTRGSTPRPADARMALFETGDFVGTIGGGRVEYLGQERCRGLLARAAGTDGAAGLSELRWVTHEETGMMCGGDALMATRILGAADIEVLEAVLSCGELGGVLVEDWSDAANPAWQVLAAVDGAEPPQAPTWDDARSRYVEALHAKTAVHVYGAGHVAQALVPVLASVGFAVRVFDERPELATSQRFPNAESVRVCRFAELAPDELPSARDYAIIMTPVHKDDYAVLEQVLRRTPFYVGCVGSRGKTARFHSWLAEAGFESALIDGIHMPVGDQIGAVTPAEIAVSIAAEMIRFRADNR